jgi:hypothetical protein
VDSHRLRAGRIDAYASLCSSESHQQAVLFYFYSPDLSALREHLLASGVQVSGITYPEYMPKGEIRVEDPDGYVLLIGQAG